MKNYTFPQQGGLYWNDLNQWITQDELLQVHKNYGHIILDERGTNSIGGYGDPTYFCQLKKLNPGIKTLVSHNCYSIPFAPGGGGAGTPVANRFYSLADSTTGGWLRKGSGGHIEVGSYNWAVDLRVEAMWKGYAKLVREHFAEKPGVDGIMFDELHQSITFLVIPNGYANTAAWEADGLPTLAQWKAAITNLVNEIRIPLIGNGNFRTAEYTPLYAAGQYRQNNDTPSNVTEQITCATTEYSVVPAERRLGVVHFNSNAGGGSTLANCAYFASILAMPYQFCGNGDFGYVGYNTYDAPGHPPFGIPIGFTPGTTEFMPAHTTNGLIISREFTNATVYFNTHNSATVTDGMAGMTGKVVWN